MEREFEVLGDKEWIRIKDEFIVIQLYFIQIELKRFAKIAICECTKCNISDQALYKCTGDVRLFIKLGSRSSSSWKRT